MKNPNSPASRPFDEADRINGMAKWSAMIMLLFVKVIFDFISPMASFPENDRAIDSGRRDRMIDLFTIGELSPEIIFNATVNGLRNGDAVGIAGGIHGFTFSESPLA